MSVKDNKPGEFNKKKKDQPGEFNKKQKCEHCGGEIINKKCNNCGRCITCSD